MQVILNCLLLSPLRPWSSSSIRVDLPTGEEPSQGTGIFLPSWFPPSRKNPILIIFLSFFLPDYVEVSCLFESLMSFVSAQYVFCMNHFTCGCISIVFSVFLWKEVNSASYSSAILISFSGTFNIFFPLHSLSHCLNKNSFGCSLFHLKKGIGLIWQTRLAPSWSFLMLLSLSSITVAYFCFDICFYSIISVISRLPSECLEFWFIPLFLAQCAFLVLLTPFISVEQKPNQNNTHEKISHHHVAATTEIWLLCIVLPQPGGFLESNIEHWV